MVYSTLEVIAKVVSTPTIEVITQTQRDWVYLGIGSLTTLGAVFIGAFLAFRYNIRANEKSFKLKTQYNAYAEIEKYLSPLLSKTTLLFSTLFAIETNINTWAISDGIFAPSTQEIARRKNTYNSLREVYDAYSNAFLAFYASFEANEIFLLEISLLAKALEEYYIKLFRIFDYFPKVQTSFMTPTGVPDEANKRSIVEESKRLATEVSDFQSFLLDFRTETQNYYFGELIDDRRKRRSGSYRRIPRRFPLLPLTILKLSKPYWYEAFNKNRESIIALQRMIYECANIVGDLNRRTSYQDKNINALHNELLRFMVSFSIERKAYIVELIQRINAELNISSDTDIGKIINSLNASFQSIQAVLDRENSLIDQISF